MELAGRNSASLGYRPSEWILERSKPIYTDKTSFMSLQIDTSRKEITAQVWLTQTSHSGIPSVPWGWNRQISGLLELPGQLYSPLPPSHMQLHSFYHHLHLLLTTENSCLNKESYCIYTELETVVDPLFGLKSVNGYSDSVLCSFAIVRRAPLSMPQTQPWSAGSQGWEGACWPSFWQRREGRVLWSSTVIHAYVQTLQRNP